MQVACSEVRDGAWGAVLRGILDEAAGIRQNEDSAYQSEVCLFHDGQRTMRRRIVECDGALGPQDAGSGDFGMLVFHAFGHIQAYAMVLAGGDIFYRLGGSEHFEIATT